MMVGEDKVAIEYEQWQQQQHTNSVGVGVCCCVLCGKPEEKLATLIQNETGYVDEDPRYSSVGGIASRLEITLNFESILSSRQRDWSRYSKNNRLDGMVRSKAFSHY